MNFWTIILLIIGGLIILGIIDSYHNNKKCGEIINSIDEEYGVPTKVIDLSMLYMTSIGETIRVYEPHRLILMKGYLINFDDILSVSVNKTEKGGDVTIESQQSTWGTIGRATVGKIVAGDTGATIGASTAKTRTKIKNEDSEITYTINITVNSINLPLIQYKLNNEDLVTEICSLMDVIINH